jgi:uncharacterized protein YbjQ (UPF0145 family)
MAWRWGLDWKSNASQLIQASKSIFFSKYYKRGIMISDPKDIALISIETVPDGLQPLGLVRGSTARSRNIGRDITAGLKNLVGGEVTSYTKLMADAREEAIYRMQEDALRIGATMVVGVRFASSMVSQGISEMVAWGTAVGPSDELR